MRPECSGQFIDAAPRSIHHPIRFPCAGKYHHLVRIPGRDLCLLNCGYAEGGRAEGIPATKRVRRSAFRLSRGSQLAHDKYSSLAGQVPSVLSNQTAFGSRLAAQLLRDPADCPDNR